MMLYQNEYNWDNMPGWRGFRITQPGRGMIWDGKPIILVDYR